MGKKKNNLIIWGIGLLLVSFLFIYYFGDKLGLPFTILTTDFTEKGILLDDFNTGIKVDSQSKQQDSNAPQGIYNKWTYNLNSGNYTYRGNNPVLPPDISSGNIQEYGLVTTNGFLRIPCYGGGHCEFDINTDFSGKKVEIVGRVEQFGVVGSTSYNLFGGSLTTIYEVQKASITSQNFVIKIEPSFFNSDEKKIYFNGILTRKTTESINPIHLDFGGVASYIWIDYISFEPTFGCDFKQGEILAYDLFNGGETINYSNFEGNVVKFCSQHPTVVHEQDKGTTTTFEIPIAIAKGNTLTIPDNQAWGIFYVLKQEGISCALNEVYVEDNKSCRKIADLEGGLRGELNQKLQEIEGLKGQLSLLSSQITQLKATVEEKGQIINLLNLELDKQIVLVKSLELNIGDNAKLINQLNLKSEEQAQMINALELKTNEQALMILELTKNIDEQAIIVNNLNLNLQEKIRLVSLLQATTEEQFKLIALMKLSFSDQQEVVNQLQGTVENDAKLISSFELKLSEEGIIIQNLRKTVEEKGQIIFKLTQNVDEQAEIIKSMKLNLEEKVRIIKELQLSNENEKLLVKKLSENLEEEKSLLKLLEKSPETAFKFDFGWVFWGIGIFALIFVFVLFLGKKRRKKRK